MTDPNPTDAVILVGGKGTRLRPLTLSAPKPMLPTAGLPFLTHLLARIEAAGIKHVVLGTSFKAEVFEEYFGDGSGLGSRSTTSSRPSRWAPVAASATCSRSCAATTSWCSTVTCSAAPI